MKWMSRQQAFTHAKKMLFHQGSHIPLIIVNTDGEVYLLPVGDDPLWYQGPDKRMLSHFIIGRAFGQQECINAKEIKSLFFIQEFWYLDREDGPVSLEDTPSKSDHRREGLGLLELQITDGKAEQSLYLCEILRHGGVLDLGPEQSMEAKSGLLVAFLAGVASSVESLEQLEEKTRRFLEVGEF